MPNKSIKLLTRQQAADYLGVSIGTLEVWASTKRYNLPYVKIGSRAMYREDSLIDFIENRTQSMCQSYLSDQHNISS